MIKKIKWRVVFAFVLSLVLLTMPATIGFAGVKAMEETGCPDVLSLVRNGVGNNAWTLGVRSYTVVSSNDNEAIVNFTDISSFKQGAFHIKWHELKKSSIQLVRKEGTLSVEWDGNKGEFTLSDMKARSAGFNFNLDKKSWVADSDLSWSILKEYNEDVKLMGAMASDFNLTRVQQLSKTTSSVQATSLCPDTSHPVVGKSYDASKSIAYYHARGSAASKCSNQYCYGCYSYISSICDCYCLAGDYFCFCSTIGFPCKACGY